VIGCHNGDHYNPGRDRVDRDLGAARRAGPAAYAPGTASGAAGGVSAERPDAEGFARREGITYTTFCCWAQAERGKGKLRVAPAGRKRRESPVMPPVRIVEAALAPSHIHPAFCGRPRRRQRVEVIECSEW
jgi:hypothetical protein